MERSSTDSPADVWTRAEAIEAFGVTYVHAGSWRDPVTESLGTRPADPFSSTVFLPTEAAAIAHVRKVARVEAQREIEHIEAFLGARAMRFRLALARSFRFLRPRERGILATESIFVHRRRELQAVLRNGVMPEVRRLPETLRVPIVIETDCPVYVVDTRHFPAEPLAVRDDVVTRRHVSASPGAGFDLVVRYELRTLHGYFAYDHATARSDCLEGAPDGVNVYLSAKAAEDSVRAYADSVVAKLNPGMQGPPAVIPTLSQGLAERSFAQGAAPGWDKPPGPLDTSGHAPHVDGERPAPAETPSAATGTEVPETAASGRPSNAPRSDAAAVDVDPGLGSRAGSDSEIPESLPADERGFEGGHGPGTPHTPESPSEGKEASEPAAARDDGAIPPTNACASSRDAGSVAARDLDADSSDIRVLDGRQEDGPACPMAEIVVEPRAPTSRRGGGLRKIAQGILLRMRKPARPAEPVGEPDGLGAVPEVRAAIASTGTGPGHDVSSRLLSALEEALAKPSLPTLPNSGDVLRPTEAVTRPRYPGGSPRLPDLASQTTYPASTPALHDMTEVAGWDRPVFALPAPEATPPLVHEDARPFPELRAFLAQEGLVLTHARETGGGNSLALDAIAYAMGRPMPDMRPTTRNDLIAAAA